MVKFHTTGAKLLFFQPSREQYLVAGIADSDPPRQAATWLFRPCLGLLG
jgi:hypothetical protein